MVLWPEKSGLKTKIAMTMHNRPMADFETVGDTVNRCSHLLNKLLAKYGGEKPAVTIEQLKRSVREPREYRRVTVAIILDVIKRHRAGASLRSIADAYGLSKPTISNILNRKRAFADMPEDTGAIPAWHASKNRGVK